MKVYGIAVIGLGSIGRKHVRLLREIYPNIKIILIRSGKGKKYVEEKLASRVINSIQELHQNEVQAAIISSPATFHLKHASQLAEKNIHLMIEKPLSVNIDGVEDLKKRVKARKLKALVGYVLRYDPCALMFKDWLKKNEIGTITQVKIECGSYLPEWRSGQDYRDTVSAQSSLGGGVLLELSHELDYLQWFFGMPIAVQSMVRNSGTLDVDVEDQAVLLIESFMGYPIIVQLDFNRRHPKRSCIVQTTEGELIWDIVQKTVKWRTEKEEVSIDQSDSDYMYREQLIHFINCIENNILPRVGLDDGANVLNIINAVICSNKKGAKVIL